MTEVLRRSLKECMLEGLAFIDVSNTVNDVDVELAEAVVDEDDVEPGRDDVKSGRDAVANCLFIIVAKEVKPEGVMVV